MVATEGGPITYTSHLLTDPTTAVGPITITVLDLPFNVKKKMAEVCPGDEVTFDALKGNSGCEIMLSSVTQPINGGTVTADFENNTFTYSAAAKRPKGACDTFTYTLVDVNGDKKKAPVVIELLCCTPCCDAFEVNPKMGQVCPGGSQIFNALEGNSGCELTLIDVTQPVNGGSVSVRGNKFKYRAPEEAPPSGMDTFTYTLEATVAGGVQEQMTVPVTMTILCCDPFIVTPKSGEACEGETICFDALEGNSGCNLRLKSVSTPINGGTVAPNFSNNTFAYTAPAILPDVQEDIFTYTMVADVVTETGVQQVEAEMTAQVNVTLLKCTPCGQAFRVNPKFAEVCPSTSFEFDALQGNSGCELALERITQPVNGGTVTIDTANNTFTYFAQEDIPPGGTDMFTYTMSAEVEDVPPADTPEATALQLQVRAEMTAPVFCTLPCCAEFMVNPKEGTACAGGTITFNAKEGNSGCNLQLTDVTQPINGGVVIADVISNSFTYIAPVIPIPTIPIIPIIPAAENTIRLAVDGPCPPIVPTADRLGQDFFTYSVTDIEGEMMRAPVTVTIECCEEFTVNPKTGETVPDGCIVFDALEGNTGCLLKLNGVTQPQFGEVFPDFVNNVFTYKAPSERPPGGVDPFTYSLVDVNNIPIPAPVIPVITIPIIPII